VYVGLAGLAFLLLSWVMNGARTAVNIVLVAFVFSYVVGPVVRWFEVRRLTRALGVLVVFLGVLFLTGLATVLLASMAGQLARFAASLPALLWPLVGWIQSLPEQIGRN
jgi:predicted PurR-regulated permease PerM